MNNSIQLIREIFDDMCELYDPYEMDFHIQTALESMISKIKDFMTENNIETMDDERTCIIEEQ
jgi:hypothetical protein